MKMSNCKGLANDVEFGVNGLRLKADSGIVELVDHNGDPVEVRGLSSSHANSLVTKSQLDAATGSDSGTVWIEYTTEPTISNFSANTPKLVTLTGGVADLKTDYSTIPSNTTWDGSDARTYIIDTTNGLITPNALDKQSHVISIEFEYVDWGSGTNTGVGGSMSLVEYNGSSEHLEIRKQWRKANNDSGTGTYTLDFHTNATNQVNGSGKGWRLYVTSLENDSNATIKIKSIRLRAG